MSTDIVLPQLGEGVTEVTISRWLKHVGDSIKKGEPILEVETDKITTEVCAEANGTLENIDINEGALAKIGATIASMSETGLTGDSTQPASKVMRDAPIDNPKLQLGNGESPIAHLKQRISPVVSRMAAEHGIDLNIITGTGEGGRVTKQDVLNYISQRKAEPAQERATSSVSEGSEELTTLPSLPMQSGEAFELQALTPMRQRIAEHMAASVRTSPHVTTIWEVDFNSVFAHRALHKAQFAGEGVSLTPLAYVIHATAAALKAHPMVNSQWREDGIALMRDINIGIAVAVDEGLLVPVIQHADELSLKGIARRIGELAGRARSKQLAPADLQGGTFTTTNHGVAGSIAATPIIPQPQCAILGLGAIEKRVKVVTHDAGDVIAIRPCAFVSLTFDHRILDGASADAFVSTFKRALEGAW